MKKILVALSIAAAFIATTAFITTGKANMNSKPDGGSGYCKIEGGGYVQVNYNEDGTLIVANQSETKTVSINVTVKAKVTCNGDERTVTIYSGTLYDFEPYSSTTIPNSRNNVTIKKKTDFGCRYSDANYHYSVQVNNPMCSRK